jgi:hypothetical protein
VREAMMRQRRHDQRQVRGAVAVARVADGRSVLQRRAVVAAAIGLAIEVLLLATRYFG